MTAAPIEWPISTGGAGKLRHHVLDVRRVVVEADDEERVVAARLAVSAQRQRMRGVALARKPRQKVRVPAPAVAVAAMDEEKRRLFAVAFGGAGRQPRTQFEVELDREHGEGRRCNSGIETPGRSRAGTGRGHRRRMLRCARHACPSRQGRHSARSWESVGLTFTYALLGQEAMDARREAPRISGIFASRATPQTRFLAIRPK